LLEQIVTYKSLVIVIAITMIPLIVFMAEADTFWGLVSIAGVIAGLEAPYLVIYWKRTTKFREMTGFLTRLTLMQIEKIAVLDAYVLEAPGWQAQFVAQITDRIVSDIRAISRIRNDILDDQRIMLRERLIRLRNILHDNHHDTARIEAEMGLLD
jgi:Na+/proline symporter